MMAKHRDKGDELPRRDRHFVSGGEGKRYRKRVKMANGQSFPTHGAGEVRPPRRPAFCMLLPDLVVAGEPAPVFGMYPAILIAKLLPWLRCDRRQILHICSGGLAPGDGIRVDIRREARPDVVADGRHLPFATSSAAAALIDPPYTEHYAKELYGVEYPRPAHLLAEAARVVRPGGRIGFVHYIVPNPPKGTRFVKALGLSMGFGYPMRAVTFFEKDQDRLL